MNGRTNKSAVLTNYLIRIKRITQKNNYQTEILMEKLGLLGFLKGFVIVNRGIIIGYGIFARLLPVYLLPMGFVKVRLNTLS